MPSRAESIPGPSADEKKKAGELARRALERYKADREVEDRAEMDAELDMLAPPSEDEAAQLVVNRMAESDVKESRSKKRKQESELQSMVQELVDESGVEMPEEKSKMDERKEMEDLDKEWAERIKQDIEKTEAKRAEKARKPKLEIATEQEERTFVGKQIQQDIRSERKSAETDPARKRSLASLKKLEGEHYNIGLELRDLTGLTPDEAYEKLVLNAGFMGRIKRGMATLAGVKTYKLLDDWFETGKKVEVLQNEVVGIPPNAEQGSRARGKRNMVNVEEAAAQATDRIFVEENPEVAAIDADFKQGIVRDAEGAVIDDEKKIRAKRPMSRVPSRKVSMGTGSLADSMAKADRVQLYQPDEASRELPTQRAPKVEAPVDPIMEFQKERSNDINVVRKEYPRAAEIWNSISTRLQSLEESQVTALSGIFGTRDISTAYVLDRAFYDMDGDQEAKARIQQADKILGIEEVSPKKVRSRSAKKAA